MFDYIFITHLPSFYKINLYNELSKKLKICVIFIGKGSNIRTQDFVSEEIKFKYYYLSDKDFEKRNMISCFINLFSLLKKIKAKKIVVGGWELPEFWLVIMLNSIDKNALALESGINDSSYNGIKGKMKKFFLSKVSTVFASGSDQMCLLKKLNYKKNTYTTRGVGIINKVKYERKDHVFRNNFLYVGRLSEEKNLNLLINVFNELQQFNLDIVGSGPLEQKLKKISKSNINFINHVENKNISEYFNKNDVFILPSISETWGLVIEESLYFGLPVIISDKVGCGSELVKNLGTGIVFKSDSLGDLKKTIVEMSQNYDIYQDNVLKFDLEKKDKEQINSYVLAINNN